MLKSMSARFDDDLDMVACFNCKQQKTTKCYNCKKPLYFASITKRPDLLNDTCKLAVNKGLFKSQFEARLFLNQFITTWKLKQTTDKRLTKTFDKYYSKYRKYKKVYNGT